MSKPNFEELLHRALVGAFGETPKNGVLHDSPFADWSLLSATLVPLCTARGVQRLAISGCQGSGKSSLARVLANTFEQLDRRALAVSIDDFYLTRAERNRLAGDVHPLLATRGVPGTHDVAWMQRVLRAREDASRPIDIPRFDKGQDDRSGVESIQADVLIMEGWCMGVQPEGNTELADPINELEAQEDRDGSWRTWVNEQIRRRYVPLWQDIDFWIHLRAPAFSVVSQWRGEAERSLPKAQRMTEVELVRFVAHYERLTQAQLSQPGLGPGVLLQLDEARKVIEVTAADRSAI